MILKQAYGRAYNRGFIDGMKVIIFLDVLAIAAAVLGKYLF